MLKKVKIKNIRPNPFRNVERYPIREQKVEALIKSFNATGGVWPVILGREVGALVEISFGHHRKTAWERVLKPIDEIEVNIMELSDAQMIKMMAHENMEEWGTSAIVEIETLSAVVKAYAEGKIELNGVPKDAPKALIRYAPSFIPGKRSTLGVERPYAAQSIANFLGWTKARGEPQQKIYTALSALQLFEEEVLTEDDFLELSSKQAEKLVSETKARLEEREREAREQEKKAQEAATRKKEATTYQARKVAEEQETYAKEKANRARSRGREEAKRVGKHLSSGMREDRIATKEASAEASKIVSLGKGDKALRSLNTATRQMIANLDNLCAEPEKGYKEKLGALLKDAAEMDYGLREFLVGALEGVADRFLEFARKFKAVQERQARRPSSSNQLKDQG